jgi:DNA-binding PadR family transcriptional regulator
MYRFSNMRRDVSTFLPLSPTTLHVLLALTNGDLHGYGIMLEITRQSGGQYKVGPGTLYASLKKLLKAGLVEESSPEMSEDSPRRRFHLTAMGSGVLAAETARLTDVLREARRCLQQLKEEQP